MPSVELTPEELKSLLFLVGVAEGESFLADPPWMTFEEEHGYSIAAGRSAQTKLEEAWRAVG